MKKIIIGIIIGMLISSGAYAAVSISSDKISYKDTTVDSALDNLFDESVSGKTKIAEAITNRGITTYSNDTFNTMANNIEQISSVGLDYSLISESVLANNLAQVGSATFNGATIGHTYLILFVNISAWLNNYTMVGTVSSGADILYTSSVVNGNAYRDAGYAQYIICKATDTTIGLTLTSMRPAYSITDLNI